jgi:hypothetical protein
MASTNPTSPKVVAAGIASVAVPVLLGVVALILDAITSGQFNIPEPWGSIVIPIATALAVVVASYRKSDPRRVTTLTQTQVDELNEPLVP